MDKQSIQDEVAEFLKTDQGGGLVAESLSRHLARNDQVLCVANTEAIGESTEQFIGSLKHLIGSQEPLQES